MAHIPAPVLPQKLHHINFEVKQVADVGAAFERALAAGTPLANMLGQHENDGMVSFYSVGPDGWQVEVGATGRQITDHFRGTADRVNRLTEDYRDLHSHLAQGAMSLCTPAAGDTPLLTSLSGSGARNTIAASVNPPLDYARPVPGDGADSIDRDHDV